MGSVRKHLKTVFVCACAALSFVSLSIRPVSEPAEALRLAHFSVVWALGIPMLFVAYRALWKKPNALLHRELWILAIILAVIVTLAQSFAAKGTTELLTASTASKISAVLFWLGRAPLYYLLMALLRDALGQEAPFALIPEPGSEPDHVARFVGKRKSVLVIAMMILLCWIPYYLYTFPGTVSNDSVTQLKEIFGVKPLSAGNPLAQTFLLWAFCAIGQAFGSADAAVALYIAVQALLMAVLLAYNVRFLIRAGAPLWLCAFSLGFFALCPVFPVFAFCVGKDTNFAMAVLFFALMVWQVLRQPKNVTLPTRFAIGLCLSAALLPLLRNPGLYLALPVLLALLMGTLIKRPPAMAAKPWLAPLCALAAVGVVWTGLHFVVQPLTRAEPMPETEEYSMPLQQVARVVASQPESLTDAEREAISGVLELDQIKAEYNGELSDPVKNLWKADASPAQKQAFFRTWLTMLGKHPATYFSAAFHNTYGYLTPGYVSAVKPTLLVGKQAHTTDIDPFFPFSVNAGAAALKAAMDMLLEQPLLRLFLAPGLYGCLALFALASILFSRRKGLLLAAFPPLFALTGCLLSAVNGYFRYAMPLYFCAPMLLALCAEALRPAKPREKTGESL